MFKSLLGWFFVIFVTISVSSNPVFAGKTEDELADLKSRIESLEQMIEKQGRTLEENIEISKNLTKIKEAFDGFSIGGGATFIMQGTNNANGDDKDVTDVSYSVDLEFEKEFGDFGLGFIHLETGDGAGVEDELQVFSNVNRDADDSDNGISVTEAWYEHYFKTVPLTLTFGKIDPTGYIDINEYANDECGQFLGHIFRNSPVVGFPDDNSAGIRIAIEPADFIDVEFVAMDANADWEDAFDNMFIVGQVNFKPNFVGKSGNYRIYGWMNDKEHLKWSDPLQNKEKNYGFGLSFDQEITDVLGVFARYGWQNPKVYADGEDFSLEHSWSAGLQLAGNLWHRNDDVFGIAFGQIFPSDDYKKAGTDLKAQTEDHLELYYNMKINDHLSVSPGIQVIWDPFGGDATNGDKTIFVAGIRAQIDL